MCGSQFFQRIWVRWRLKQNILSNRADSLGKNIFHQLCPTYFRHHQYLWERKQLLVPFFNKQLKKNSEQRQLASKQEKSDQKLLQAKRQFDKRRQDMLQFLNPSGNKIKTRHEPIKTSKFVIEPNKTSFGWMIFICAETTLVDLWLYLPHII